MIIFDHQNDIFYSKAFLLRCQYFRRKILVITFNINKKQGGKRVYLYF
jgi:hypothetical protein